MLRIHISSHNDDLHKGTAKRNLAGGVVGLKSDSKINSDYLPGHLLTESQFSDNAGTGTVLNPQYLNDNTGFRVEYDVVNEYVQILFNDYALISEYRQDGVGLNLNGDGRFKIQYLWGGIWIDNTIDIIPRNLNSWSNWTYLSFPVITKGIRLVATALDTSFNKNFIKEMDIRG